MDKKSKTYSAEEVAVAVLEKIKKLYKNSELSKANTAHEIEAGSEPVTNDTECPEFLAEEIKVKDKKKKGESSEPEHEEGMSEEENKIHDAAEQEADEADSDNIEADEELEESEESEGDPEPEHEKNMPPKEEMEHDAKENDEDEKDADKIEADEEVEESENDTEEIIDNATKEPKKDKKEEKKKPFEKNEKMTLKGFLSKREEKLKNLRKSLEKADIIDLKTKKVIATHDEINKPKENLDNKEEVAAKKKDKLTKAKNKKVEKMLGIQKGCGKKV